MNVGYMTTTVLVVENNVKMSKRFHYQSFGKLSCESCVVLLIWIRAIESYGILEPFYDNLSNFVLIKNCSQSGSVSIE